MNNDGEKLRLLLVDENTLFRCGIARLLETQPDFEVVAATGDFDEALRCAEATRPHVLLIDPALQPGDGPAITRRFKRHLPDTRVVILAPEVRADDLLGCVLAGAEGYLNKNITPDELFMRLRGLRRGEAALALTTAAVLMQRLSASRCTLCLQASINPDLTPREAEILGLVARGLTNRHIGSVLGISEHTVRNHLCSIYQKLNLKNRLQVAVYSVTHGLVDLNNVSGEAIG